MDTELMDIDGDHVERMAEHAEDLADIQAAAAARAELTAGVPPIPWEEVKAELGLSERPVGFVGGVVRSELFEPLPDAELDRWEHRPADL